MSNNILFQIIFSDIYCEKNKPLLSKANAFLDKYCLQLIDNFYSTLSAHKEMNDVFSNEIVGTHLKNSMKLWFKSLLQINDNLDFSAYIQKQQVIGDVHARIRIPMEHVNFGIDIIKQNICELLQCEPENDENKTALLNLIFRAIDLAAMVTNDAYVHHSIKQEKNEQNLQHHYISHNLAFEFEQSRSDLLHWHRELMTILFYPYSTSKHQNVTTLNQSKFGLWLEHRASLLFYNQKEIKLFNDNVRTIDVKVKKVISLNQKESWEQLAKEISELDTLITSTDWLLNRVSKDIIAIENNKDPLTKMFTRRYLPNIIQHEIRYCLEHNTQLGVIMLDLDHFKHINDEYGHSVGDTVLNKTASLMSSSIRAYDYIFRYGGEEFLIIINNTDETKCLSIAENIRSKIEGYQFTDLPFLKAPVTISLGVAIFDQHPDYEQLIDHADKALYLAKENGRNRVEIYKEETMSV